MSKLDQTIEREHSPYDEGEQYTVYEHGEYEESSVLAGQQKRQYKDTFTTLAQAQAAYPEAVSIAGSTKQNIEAMTAHLYAGTEGDYSDPTYANDY